MNSLKNVFRDKEKQADLRAKLLEILGKDWVPRASAEFFACRLL